MKIAVPRRHRRLFVLCACSAAVHVAILKFVAAHGPGPAAVVPSAGELSVRLTPSRAGAGEAPAPSTFPLASAPVTPAPRTTTAAHAPPDRATEARPAAAPTPAAAPAPASAPAAPSASEAPAPDVPARGAAESPEPAPPPMQMPGRYRARLPPSVLLTYDLTRPGTDGASATAGTAQLAWRTDGERYQLDVDGPTGRLHSEGVGGDAGIVPLRASEEAPGGPLVTEFASERHRVLFRAAGTEAPDNIGIQDRASLLMQLAGMGLADPGQVADTIEIAVAGARDVRVARLQVMGKEDVATGLGTLGAWHLTERAAPGQPRLEVWLAPQQGWLPVQIRTDEGGAIVTRTLRAVAPAPDLPAPALP